MPRVLLAFDVCLLVVLDNIAAFAHLLDAGSDFHTYNLINSLKVRKKGQKQMQGLAIKSLFQFSRVPMIKFIGSRANLPKQTLKQPFSSSSSIPSAQSESSIRTSGKAIQIPSVTSPFLSEAEIEAVNMGGFVDVKYEKVKPISMR